MQRNLKVVTSSTLGFMFNHSHESVPNGAMVPCYQVSCYKVCVVCVCCVCCICRPCTAQTRTAARRHACPPCSVLHALDLQSHFQTSGRNVRQRIAPGFGLLLHGLSLLGPYTAVHSINTAGKDVPSGPYCWSCDPKCLVPGVLSGVLVLLHIVPQSVPWFLQEIKHIYHARPAPWRACSL